MGTPSDGAIAAAKAVIGRLLQMRQLWEDAASFYFQPDRFQLSLQNCITVSRTVTFILQANKQEVSGFDGWYTKHQESWRDDAIMTWARDARNAIEKRGDLETHSQVRATIIASYMDEGPQTEWMPQALFASPQQIYRSVPSRFLIPHIVENGTLLIERRWVDRGLPDLEVLEALAHVYARLADMVTSLLIHLGLPVPSVIARSKPDAMGTLAMDRALYLSMRDGSLRGYRYFRKRLDAAELTEQKRLVRRYGKAASWKHLESAKTFRAVAEGFFRTACAVMLRDGFHQNFAFFLSDHVIFRILPVEFPDRASKYVLARDLARLARIDGANGVIMIGEAWTASPKDVPTSGFAADAKNRGEALMMNAANSKGESFVIEAVVKRKKNKPDKVKRLGSPEIDDGGFQFILYPFMKEWDCVDESKIDQARQRMDALGIEPTVIPGEQAS